MTMKKRKLFFLLIFLISITGCSKKEEPLPEQPPEGSINLSELTTKTDYYLPFAIVNDKDNISAAVLNGEAIAFSSGDFIKFEETGFYELVLKYKDQGKPDETILFTTKVKEREAAEWGIREWVPESFESVFPAGAEIEGIYPRHYSDTTDIPFIFYIKESGIIKPVYCEGMSPSTGTAFNIKQGAGSVVINSASITSQARFTIGSKQFIAPLTKIQGAPIELKGTINSRIVIPANALVRIKANLDILASGSLVINEGALILVDEAVDINVSGPVTFAGSSDNPILVTCSRRGGYWGGFITRVATGTVKAQHSIFCRSGYHNTSGYFWGHAGRQALFYTENSTLDLDHCYITDHIGQIFYPINSSLNLTNILVQRAKTGGQVNYSNLILRNSIFTDFPDDTYEYKDEDNDALYLSASDAQIENTIFMYAKDDGLDSGNTEGGTITLSNCRFEACFHEGAALSSGNNAVKKHTFTNCVFTNCGQGLELGFSSPNHLVVAENCQFLKNGVGIRYGDNYEWAEVEGKMIIRNSFSLNNDRDVWNMVRMTWSPVLENLTFENTVVSKPCPQYPGLPVMVQ
jgi:hypothetical protein